MHVSRHWHILSHGAFGFDKRSHFLKTKRNWRFTKFQTPDVIAKLRVECKKRSKITSIQGENAFFKTYNCSIMRFWIVRLNPLWMNKNLERIIPYHAVNPLTENFYQKLKLRSITYYNVKTCYCGQLQINIILIRCNDTIQKISNG